MVPRNSIAALYLPSCQPYPISTLIPLYGELYLLPTPLVRRRDGLSRTKRRQQQDHNIKNSRNNSKQREEYSRHRSCCDRLLQLLLCRPSRNTSRSTAIAAAAAAVRTSSQHTASCSTRPNYCENRTRTVRAISH